MSAGDAALAGTLKGLRCDQPAKGNTKEDRIQYLEPDHGQDAVIARAASNSENKTMCPFLGAEPIVSKRIKMEKNAPA